MDTSFKTRKQRARLAGILYLILAITSAYAMIVNGKGLVESEFLNRTAIAGHLASVLSLLFLAFTLHKLFKPVDEHLSRQLLIFVTIQVPIIFLIETFRITSLMIANGKVPLTSTPVEAQNLSVMLIKIHAYGIQLVKVFWGLWLIPFAQLIIKSGFIPKILGILLWLPAIAYPLDSAAFILFPEYRQYTMIPAYTFSGIGEISVISWLLIKGVKDHISIEVVSESDRKVA